jgi:catecholate siderophore receptor
MKSLLVASTSGVTLLLSGFGAVALGAEVVEAPRREESTVIVIGKLEGYRALEATSGTKTTTDLLNVPQSVAVVTRAQMDDQAILTISDLVRSIPGVTSGQGEGHRDQITLRGNNSTADFFVNGLRDDVQYYRSLYNVERVEAHKGPNAMIFGRGGGGGVINRITKGALLDRQVREVTASFNTYGSGYLAGDLNIPGENKALRINTFYEGLANHRDGYDGERFGINPVLGLKLGDVWKLQLGYEYVTDDRVVDRGVPSASLGTLAAAAGPVAGFTTSSFGLAGTNYSNFEGQSLDLRAEAALSDTLTLKVNALYGDYDKFYQNVFVATAVTQSPTGPSVGVEAYADALQRETLILQGNLEWRVQTGLIKHIVLAGAEFTEQDSFSERINGFFDPLNFSSANRRRSVPFVVPFSVPTVTWRSGPTGNSNRAVRSKLSQGSLYLQDQASIGDHFDLIAGVRFDNFDIAVTNRFTGVTVSRTDQLVSPRFGLVYKPIPEAALYVSYSKSYLPQAGDQFLTLDASTAALEPETFDNFEIGAKWDILPSLTFTAALYQLDRSNTRATGAIPGTFVLTGEQRSKGFEVSFSGAITEHWDVVFGYANTDAEVTSTTSAAPTGRKIGQVPRHQMSLWNRYQVTEKLSFGLGAYYQSSQFTTISNVTRLPGYTRVDAALFYALTDTVDVQLNIENALDKTYFPVAHNDNNISPGAPTNARLTVRARF